MSLRVLLLDIGSERSRELERMLQELGFTVLGPARADQDLFDYLPPLSPDVVVIAADSPQRDSLEHLGGLFSRYRRPMVMLTQHCDPELTRTAAGAGVCAYVVEGLCPSLVGSLVQVTMLTFASNDALQTELEHSRRELNDTRIIQQAKRLLATKYGFTEDEAHSHLRRLSQDVRKPMVVVARRVLRAGGFTG